MSTVDILIGMWYDDIMRVALKYMGLGALTGISLGIAGYDISRDPLWIFLAVSFVMTVSTMWLFPD